MYSIKVYGKKYEYPMSYSREQITTMIAENLVRDVDEARKKITNSIDGFLRSFDPMNVDTDEVSEFCRKNNLNESAFNTMLKHSGLFKGYKYFMRYSDLRNLKDVRLRELYHQDFVGVDPYIIIHSIEKNGTVNASILNITHEKLKSFNRRLS